MSQMPHDVVLLTCKKYDSARPDYDFIYAVMPQPMACMMAAIRDFDPGHNRK